MTKDSIRRVRFALVDHPSPVSTSSTLSSPGPRTPQQAFQSLPLIAEDSTFSSPPISPKRFPLTIPHNIHEALSLPKFNFDVSIDPANNHLMRENAPLQRIRNEPATIPPVSSLTIVSVQLPWEITILPSAYSCVTISDILGGLYRALRLPAREEEYYRENPEKQNAISLAYYNRFERHGVNSELRESEKRKGVKRVDFLVGAHRFRGLSRTERPNVWNIKFKH